MKKLKNYSIIILCLFTSLVTFSQNIISGKVTSTKDSSALVGVTIYIPDLKLGAATDAEGNYTIKNVPKGSFLAIASYIGYAPQTKEISVNKNATFNFSLEESGASMNEVIVTGVSSATERRSDPIAVSVVNQKDFL